MSDATQSPDGGACGPMGTTDAHERLKPFEGTFQAEVKMWMGPGDPHTSTGTMTNAFELGGRFLKQNYKGHDVDGPFPNFEGRGYWGYNTVNNCYEGFWIDTAATFFQIETGQVDDSGKVWEMTGTMTNPQTGDPLVKRSVITLHDENSHTMEMFFEAQGQPSCKAMEIVYTRSS